MKKDLTSIKNKIYSKYHKETWFVSIDIYGDNELVIYYKDSKNMLPWGSGNDCVFHKFAGVGITWKKVDT